MLQFRHTTGRDTIPGKVPSTANLAVYQGDDYAGIVTVSNESGPFDLADFDVQAQIRTGPADTAAEIVAEVTAVVVLPNQIALSISHAVTEVLTGKLVWDLQVIERTTGNITTLLAGHVTVTREVTR